MTEGRQNTYLGGGDSHFTIHVPEPSGWRCVLFGNTVFVPTKPCRIPNWFWRKMHYLVFGIRWERV